MDTIPPKIFYFLIFILKPQTHTHHCTHTHTPLYTHTHTHTTAGDEELKYWTKLEANKKLKASGGKGRAGYKRKARHDYRPRAHKQAKTED